MTNILVTKGKIYRKFKFQWNYLKSQKSFIAFLESPSNFQYFEKKYDHQVNQVIP